MLQFTLLKILPLASGALIPFYEHFLKQLQKSSFINILMRCGQKYSERCFQIPLYYSVSPSTFSTVAVNTRLTALPKIQKDSERKNIIKSGCLGNHNRASNTQRFPELLQKMTGAMRYVQSKPTYLAIKL